MDSYNSYLSDIQSSMGNANTLQQQAIAKTEAKARTQQEEQEPLNLLGAELLTGGIKGVRQRFIKKVGQKVAEKTGSKSLGKFVEDIGGGKSIEESARTATQGAVDNVSKKAEGSVNKVTTEAKNIARQAKTKVEQAKTKASSVIDETKAKAEDVKTQAGEINENIKLDTLPELTPEQEQTFNPRPKRNIRQVTPKPKPKEELDPIEAEREGYGKDLLAPENKPDYDDSNIDIKLQREAKGRALGDIKPPDRGLENIKPYNKPKNIKKAKQQQEQRDNAPVETHEEAQPKFDDPDTLPPPIAEPYDPTQELEGEFKGEGGQFKRGGLTIDAGEEQDKVEPQAETEPDLPPLRDVTLDQHLENVEDLNDTDYEEYKNRVKGIDPLDYSKKSQIVDDIKARPARITEEARESLGLTEEPEELEESEEQKSLPLKGSVENPLTEAEAPAPPPPRPTAPTAPTAPVEEEEDGFIPVKEGEDPLTRQEIPPPPKIDEPLEQSGVVDKDIEGDVDKDIEGDVEKSALKTTEKTGLGELTAESSVFDENPLGDIVTAGLGLASLIVPLFSHAPKESPVNPINPSSQFGES